MKRIFIIRIFSFLLICAFFNSCIEDQINRAYTGSVVVEFKNAYLERQSQLGSANLSILAPYLVTGENTSLNSITVREQAATFTDSILVQVVGPLSSQEIQLDYTIDASSTATEGVSFSILDRAPEGKVIIPAGKSQGYIVFDVLNGLLPVDPARVNIIFNLMGNSQISPSENYKQFTYTIVNN